MTVNLMRYICNYQYQNENRSLEIEADSHEDAQSQISAIAYTGTVTGVLERSQGVLSISYEIWLLFMLFLAPWGLLDRLFDLFFDGDYNHYYFSFPPSQREIGLLCVSAFTVALVYTLKPKKV